jgi:hypothetical protein
MNPAKNALPIATARVTQQDVESKCDYFIDVQLWPLRTVISPRQWLENFQTSEIDHAIHLLNAFLYFSESTMDAMFKAAFQDLSRSVARPADSFLMLQASWRSFWDTLLVTYVTGETPNPTDSGFVFARKARQLLGIPEERIMRPDDAVRTLIQRPGPLVFVDDFVGSGNQFWETWRRPVLLPNSVMVSFEKLATVRGNSFFYCPLISTEAGYNRLRTQCPGVLVSPVHILSNRYSALADDSLVWPPDLRASALGFLKSASERAGIPDNDGNVNDWRGFHKLGLAITFAHSVPDATLPIFYWEENGWKPLMRRK